MLQIQSAVFHNRPPSAARLAPRRWTPVRYGKNAGRCAARSLLQQKFLIHFSFDIGINKLCIKGCRFDVALPASSVKCRWRSPSRPTKTPVQGGSADSVNGAHTQTGVAPFTAHRRFCDKWRNGQCAASLRGNFFSTKCDRNLRRCFKRDAALPVLFVPQKLDGSWLRWNSRQRQTLNGAHSSCAARWSC